MSPNFDQLIERRGTDSGKWQQYGNDVLPLWVADMDFVSPQPVIDALQQRISHGVFGYGSTPTELSNTICERLERLYNWHVTAKEIVFLPGLVSGLNVVCRATGEPGSSVLVQTPVYPPFLKAPGNQAQTLDVAQLTLRTNGSTLSYEIDFDAFEAAIKPTTRLFILCNPHNPIGREYTVDELTRLAEICARHNLIICSDEIHCDLLLNGTPHRPLVTVAPEIAGQCITLMAPSKTFNVPGLGCSFAIIQDVKLRKQFNRAVMGIVPHVNILGSVAAHAAYTQGGEWLEQLLAYLAANRDFVVDYVTNCLPGMRVTVPEATYLAWLDCRETGIEGNPHHFFLEHAKVALNDGELFGPGGEGFVRLNFGCTRATLGQALNQMREALLKI